MAQKHKSDATKPANATKPQAETTPTKKVVAPDQKIVDDGLKKISDPIAEESASKTMAVENKSAPKSVAQKEPAVMSNLPSWWGNTIKTFRNSTYNQ